jgi:hypothetical protein
MRQCRVFLPSGMVEKVNMAALVAEGIGHLRDGILVCLAVGACVLLAAGFA